MNREHEEAAPAALRGLRMEVEPERDLWPGIAARIGATAPRRRSPARRWLGYALAASLVGAVAVQLTLTREAVPPAGPELAAAAVPGPAPSAVGRVIPAEQALLKANLAIVRDAERQLEHALEQDPDSAALQRLLATTRAQRGQLKTRLAGTAQET